MCLVRHPTCPREQRARNKQPDWTPDHAHQRAEIPGSCVWCAVHGRHAKQEHLCPSASPFVFAHTGRLKAQNQPRWPSRRCTSAHRSRSCQCFELESAMTPQPSVAVWVCPTPRPPPFSSPVFCFHIHRPFRSTHTAGLALRPMDGCAAHAKAKNCWC